MKTQAIRIVDEQGKLLNRITIKAQPTFNYRDFGKLSLDEQGILYTLNQWALSQSCLLDIYVDQSTVKTKSQQTAYRRNGTRAIKALLGRGLVFHTPDNCLFCIPAINDYINTELADLEIWLKG